MSVSIPQPFHTDVDVSTAQPFRVKAEGIPDDFTIGIDELPTIHLSVDALPKVEIGFDPIRIGFDPIQIALTEIPSVRTHLPADFAVGFSLWGTEIGAIRLCGEAQVITEPYRPNPCEVCGAVERPGQTAPHLAAVPANVVEAGDAMRESKTGG